MLSKEEIEDIIESKFNNSEEENFGLTVEEAKHIALYEERTHYCSALTQASYNILLQYIEQIETELKIVTTQRNKLATELSDKEDDKQKLIEKLEKACKKVDDKMADFEAIEIKQEILKIVKGENE